MDILPDQQHSPSQRQRSAKPAKRQQSSRLEEQAFVQSTRSRGRSGCLNCRRRRKKCDETKPVCSKCTSRKESCEWDSGFSFRVSGIDAQHPSMVQSRLSKPQNAKTCKILNVMLAVGKSCSKPTDPGRYAATIQDTSFISEQESSWESNGTRAIPKVDVLFPDDVSSLNDGPPEDGIITKRQRTGVVNQFLCRSDTLSSARSLESVSSDISSNETQHIQARGTDMSGCPVFETNTSNAGVEHMELDSDHNLTARTRVSQGSSNHHSGHVQLDFTSIELEALDYLTCQSSNLSLFPPNSEPAGSLPWNSIDDSNLWSSPIAESPDTTHSYPNVAYKTLHTVLYHHMVETARNTASTRHGSPDRLSHGHTVQSNDIAQSFSFSWPGKLPQESSLDTTSSSFTKIPERRQIELWRNYLDEIAVWLDMFDSERHFQLQIPQLAKPARHLQYSVLALSARQLERKDPERPYTESLGLYQEAIHLILRELHTLDTAVIASCVLLCVLEMMSSAPRAWSRHLNGCAMLLEAAGVNGVVGGVRQSLFWCFARMDVWGGFLGDTLTKIPTSRWFVPSRSMLDAISHFKEGSGCDSYANYSVFLCASVVNVISNRGDSSASEYGVESASTSTFAARWKALFDLLEDWYQRRPTDMQPLISFPSVLGEHQHPFPSVLYSNSPAINGNQLYHAATLLMLQEKPKEVHLPKGSRSILWHARQICGIAASNHRHGPWINALQPIWIAGKIMSHATEHEAILEILARIERETGWATAWRAQDLRDYWGDADG